VTLLGQPPRSILPGECGACLWTETAASNREDEKFCICKWTINYKIQFGVQVVIPGNAADKPYYLVFSGPVIQNEEGEFISSPDPTEEFAKSEKHYSDAYTFTDVPNLNIVVTPFIVDNGMHCIIIVSDP
jgi:hypothetical protein